jgi:GDP-L-fucose synthase
MYLGVSSQKSYAGGWKPLDKESKQASQLKIYVSGHRGLVGSAIVRAIESNASHRWIGKTHSELELLDRKAVFEFVASEKPDAIIIAAAKVGGIHANNTYPVQFLTENLQIETNLMDAAHAAGISRLLFLGSSCVYPKMAQQPIKEEYLLTGELEKTNEAYALAKISGLKLVQAYRSQYGHKWISAMPTNMYGPGDNFDLENSHVLPALIRKFHDAKLRGDKKVILWGTGSPLREFLHSDDLASACLFLLENYDDEVAINVGTGKDISIKDLAELIKSVVGFDGQIDWDITRHDGTPRKLLDVTRLTGLGWTATIELRDGIERTYESFLSESSQP